MTNQTSKAASTPAGDPRAAAMLVAFIMFLSILEATIIATAIPEMAVDFAVPASEMAVSITVYLLIATAFLPISSWVALRLGPRRVLMGAVLGFGAASLLCSLSTGLEAFVAARALQALCASMMVPVGNLVLLRITPKHRLVEMMAISTTPALIAPVIGPPLGGFLTEGLGWQSIFWINIPLTIIGSLLAWRLLPRVAPERLRFDAVGFVMTASALALLIAGLDRLAAHPETPVWSLVTLAAGAAMAVIAFRHMKRAPHGLIPLDALRHHTFRAIAFGPGMFMRLPHMGQALVLPLYFQLAFGLSPGMAGVLLLANNLGDLVVKPFVGRIIRATGFRRALIWGTAMMMAAVAGCAALNSAMPFWLMAALMFLFGVLRSVPFTGMVSLAFADVDGDELPGANVMSSIGNTLSASAGISLGALFLNLSIGDAGQADPLPYRIALLAMAAIGSIAVIQFLRLPETAGAHVARKVKEPPVPA